MRLLQQSFFRTFRLKDDADQPACDQEQAEEQKTFSDTEPAYQEK